MNYFKLLNFCLIPFFMLGCSISDEGATDYRYYEPNDSKLLKYIKPSDINSSVSVDDALVVSIKQVYINNFIEWRTPLRIIRREPANGEVAVVVNAFEQGNQSLDFGPQGLENGKVVFFSDDVWEGQYLNFSNLSTVYGPLKYNGNSFIIDLYIIELDQPGEQLKQLITNLSQLSSTFYPPASPIAGAVSKLSNSLISDQQEDRMLHYTFELKPIGGDFNLESGFLSTGNYVFVREHERDEHTRWSDLDMNSRTGRLIYKDKTFEVTSPAVNQSTIKSCSDSDIELPEKCFYKENTYVVIEVNKVDSSLKNDTQQMVYKDLVNKFASTPPELYKSTLTTDTLAQLAEGVSAMRVNNLLLKDINTLISNQNSIDSNNVALSSFIHMWFSDNAEGGKNYQLQALEQQKLERRVGGLISLCLNDQTEIIDVLDTLRTRSFEQYENKVVQINNALTCKHTK